MAKRGRAANQTIAPAPEEPNVYSPRAQPNAWRSSGAQCAGRRVRRTIHSAPLERRTLWTVVTYKHSVPPGLSDLVRNLSTFPLYPFPLFPHL
jgi:hypothetical protein